MSGNVNGLGGGGIGEQNKYLGGHPGLCAFYGPTGATTVFISFTSAPTILSGVSLWVSCGYGGFSFHALMTS